MAPHPLIVEHLKEAGIWVLTQINKFSVDTRLVTALLERWRPETHTFLLPIKECTITLEDIHMLMGLKVNGVVVTGSSKILWSLCENVIGKVPQDHEKDRKSFKLTWLQRYLEEMCVEPRPEHLMHHFRVYVLYLIGKLLMSNTSGNKVHLKWMMLLHQPPTEIGKYS